MGKGKYQAIVLKAVADDNLWFWHTAFGFDGSCNDINIRGAIPQYKCFIDGAHSHIDFDSTIGNHCVFKSHIKLWMVTLSFSFHHNNLCPNLSKGQGFCSLAGGSHKDVEHTFCVLQSKWHILTQPHELWDST